MRYCEIFVYQLVVPLLLGACTSTRADDCWTNETECIVHATLHSSDSESDSQTMGLPMEIDCLPSLNNTLPELATESYEQAYLQRRFGRSENVTLNGCHTPFSVTSYGFEALPNCGKIVHLTIERFHADSLQQFYCPAAEAIQVEVIVFRNNEIGVIAADSMARLTNLRQVHFERNFLRHIDRTAFDALQLLELIHIEEEPLLAIKDADLLELLIAIADVRLIGLKRVTMELFNHLPATLRQIRVAQTPIAGHMQLTNPQLLRNVTVVGCALTSFILIDNYATVLSVNLSGNDIRDFKFVEVIGSNETECALETLDLSRNRLLSFVVSQWLSSCRLRYINLSDNLLKTLSLGSLLSALPAAHFIDLRENQLVALRDASADIDCERTRINIDRNHWNCKWLLDFAHTHPEKFRLFQYDKFISKINVNGLECSPEEMPNNILENPAEDSEDAQTQSTVAKPMNVSTYTLVYGNPWDIKRNQRAEALIIVFMLPLGIALLFLLLYMWIYCQKIFHWSYYPCFNPLSRDAVASSAERFDVVRQFPPANTAITTFDPNCNGGYEIPLNCVAAVCSCNNIGANASDCKKTHHITYEALPTEPFMMYEEVLGDNGHTMESFYDHIGSVPPEPTI